MTVHVLISRVGNRATFEVGDALIMGVYATVDGAKAKVEEMRKGTKWDQHPREGYWYASQGRENEDDWWYIAPHDLRD